MKILVRAVRSFSVLIVEDQQLVRQGLALVLKQHFPDARIREAGDGSEAMHALMLYKTDIVLLDIGLPEIGGVEIARRILLEYPNVKVLIVTQYNGEAMIRNLVKAGVHSFFLKNTAAHHIKDAVTAVLAGKQYIPDSLKNALLPATHVPAIAFNRREAEILLLLKMGRSTKEISERMQLKEFTIKSYREGMLKKTKTGNVAQLISYAYENGIIG